MSKDNPFDPSEIVVHHFPDRSMRRLLQDPDYVRCLVEIIAPDLVGYLDFGRGSQQNRTFILLILHRRSDDEREELIALVKQHSRDESEVGIMAQTAAELLVEQGKAEGIVEGKREAVLRLLQFRFQDIPEAITERIASIETSSDLDTLLEQAMTVRNLDDIQV